MMATWQGSKTDGWKALDKENFQKIEHLVNGIPFNIFFARMVIEKKISGTVYVDDIQQPRACLIHHPYGMLLLAGEPEENFSASLKNFMLNNDSERTLWLQASENWHDEIDSLLGYDLKYFDGCQSIAYQLKSGVIRFRRLNFKFNKKKYLAQKKLQVPDGLELVETNGKLFSQFDGTVVARYFWDTPYDFIQGGRGFTLLDGEKIASASFSAFMIDNFLEIGIETAEDYRGKGHAEIVCRALIDYALENSLEPVWSCRGDNIGSKKLAERMGFEVSLELPYYGLRKNGTQ